MQDTLWNKAESGRGDAGKELKVKLKANRQANLRNVSLQYDLTSFTQDQLCEIHSDLNGWTWPALFGEKPEWWDMLKDWHRFSFMRIFEPSKHDVIRPVMREIRSIVPYKSIMHHHFIHNGFTEKYFEEWWENERAL